MVIQQQEFEIKFLIKIRRDFFFLMFRFRSDFDPIFEISVPGSGSKWSVFAMLFDSFD